MRVSLRPFALIAVCGVAMLCTACGSKNKGKIEGKWKLTEPPNSGQKEQDDFKELAKQGVYMFFDFKADDTLTVGLHSDNEELIKAMKQFVPNQQITWNLKYKLLSGENVEFYGLPKELQEKGGGGFFGANKDKARTKISISGDNMTMTEPDGKTGKLVRMK